MATVYGILSRKKNQWFLSDLELVGNGRGKFTAENDGGAFFREAV